MEHVYGPWTVRIEDDGACVLSGPGVRNGRGYRVARMSGDLCVIHYEHISVDYYFLVCEYALEIHNCIIDGHYFKTYMASGDEVHGEYKKAYEYGYTWYFRNLEWRGKQHPRTSLQKLKLAALKLHPSILRGVIKYL